MYDVTVELFSLGLNRTRHRTRHHIMCVKTAVCSPLPWKSPRFFLNKKLEASIMREMELIDTISKLNHPHVVGARAERALARTNKGARAVQGRERSLARFPCRASGVQNVIAHKQR